MWPLLLALGTLFILSRGGKRLRLPDALPPLRVSPRISSRFGWRIHPIHGDRRMHEGIDLAVPTGTPVYSPVDGFVNRVDADGIGRGETNGNAVLMRGAGLSWAFLHLSTVEVTSGQAITKGQLLGHTGATGQAKGPHLHLQITDSTGPVDPETILRLT